MGCGDVLLLLPACGDLNLYLKQACVGKLNSFLCRKPERYTFFCVHLRFVLHKIKNEALYSGYWIADPWNCGACIDQGFSNITLLYNSLMGWECCVERTSDRGRPMYFKPQSPFARIWVYKVHMNTTWSPCQSVAPFTLPYQGRNVAPFFSRHLFKSYWGRIGGQFSSAPDPPVEANCHLCVRVSWQYRTGVCCLDCVHNLTSKQILRWI